MGVIISITSTNCETDKGYSRKKIPREGGGGKKANNIFFYGWLVRTFFKLYGSLVFEKVCLNGWWGFIEKNLLLTFDRYIKSNVLVSIKILNHNLPVFLLCEIRQSTHKLILCENKTKLFSVFMQSVKQHDNLQKFPNAASITSGVGLDRTKADPVITIVLKVV